MALRGEAKKNYQRTYMRLRRAQARALAATTNVLPKDEARAYRARPKTLASVLRDNAALAFALLIRKTGAVPPVTASQRAQADLSTIRMLGDLLRAEQQRGESQERRIARLEREQTTIRSRLTLQEAASVLQDIPYSVQDGYVSFEHETKL